MALYTSKKYDHTKQEKASMAEVTDGAVHNVCTTPDIL
jgi:hypothetical protein